jgi:hypothetical protein
MKFKRHLILIHLVYIYNTIFQLCDNFKKIYIYFRYKVFEKSQVINAIYKLLIYKLLI